MFFVEQWVSVVCGMTAQGMCGRFEIFEYHLTFEMNSNWDVRLEFESNLEASQVHSFKVTVYSQVENLRDKVTLER